MPDLELTPPPIRYPKCQQCWEVQHCCVCGKECAECGHELPHCACAAHEAWVDRQVECERDLSDD